MLQKYFYSFPLARIFFLHVFKQRNLNTKSHFFVNSKYSSNFVVGMKAAHAVHISELMMCAVLILNVFLMSLKNHSGSTKIVLINE